jgi:hypothetical protein
VGSLVAYPVEKPVFRFGSTTNDVNFVNAAARGKSASADRFPSTFTFISIGAAVIRSGSEPTPTTTRGGVA